MASQAQADADFQRKIDHPHRAGDFDNNARDLEAAARALALLVEVKEAARAYSEDPLDINDRPESWGKLDKLVSVALRGEEESDASA